MSEDKTISMAALRATAERCGIDGRLGDAELVLAAVGVLEEIRSVQWDEGNDWHYEQERIVDNFMEAQARIKP